MSEEEWDAVISVHLKGHFAPTRHAAAHWREAGKRGEVVNGRVINTSSPSGVFGNVGQTNYGAAKAGIAAFTMIAAQELQRYDITVNCIAPNARTRMTEALFDAAAGDDDPLDPSHVTSVVVALCADDAGDITGQCFHVYGRNVNVLRPWDAGVLLSSDSAWTARGLLERLLVEFPDGLAPAGMTEMVERVGGSWPAP